MLSAVGELAPAVGTPAACRALGVSRATVYRRRRPRAPSPRPSATPSSRSCVDLAPAEVYATLLDEGRYLCGLRTMYRLLAAAHEVRERRNQLRHVAPKPELLVSVITKFDGKPPPFCSQSAMGWPFPHQSS